MATGLIRLALPFTPDGSTDIPTRAILTKLNAKISLALVSPEFRNRLNNDGTVATLGTPEAFGALIVREIACGKLVITSGRAKAD